MSTEIAFKLIMSFVRNLVFLVIVLVSTPSFANSIPFDTGMDCIRSEVISVVPSNLSGQAVVRETVMIRNVCQIPQYNITVEVVFKTLDGKPAGVHTQEVVGELLQDSFYEFTYQKTFPPKIIPAERIYAFTSWNRPRR